MKKGWQGVICAFCLFAILFGCQSREETSADRIKQDIAFLCSDECNGRLPGSDGNKLAEKYIQTIFEQAGLTPLKGYDSLLIPYTQQVFDMDTEQLLTAVFPDGDRKVFQGSVDFYPCIGDGFSGEVTLDPSDAENKVYLWKEGQPAADDASAIVQETDRGSAIIMTNCPTLMCRSEIFGQLEGCMSLSLEGAAPREEAVDNVVGILRGGNADAENALLLTAHFDHVGGYGDVIYRGALDNASGVALLLETVRQLAAAGNTAEHDIVFAAFNGEDMGLKGSKALAAMLPYETVNVINFDCVGYKDEPALGVAGENEELQTAVISAFQNVFTCGPIGSSTSDHQSFETVGIPAVMVTNDFGELNIFETIHHTEDIPDILDIDAISAMVEPVCQYAQASEVIRPKPQEPEQHSVPTVQNREEILAFYAEARAAIDAADLTYDQVLPMERKDLGAGYVCFVCDNSFLVSVDAAEAVISPARFPESLGGFQLDRTSSLLRVYDEELGQYNIGMRLIDTNREDYELGVPRKKTDDDKTSTWSLNYTDGEVVLELLANKRSQPDLERSISQFEEVQTSQVDGGTIYQCFSTWEGNKFSYMIIYEAEDIPYYYALYNNIYDNSKTIDSEAHLQLMLDAIPRLREIPELP